MTPSACEINKINRAFWAKQSPLALARLDNECNREFAFSLMRDEHLRGITVASQMSLEGALAVADGFRKKVVVAQSKKAARAPRVDVLNERIREIVERRPSISCDELVAKLGDECGVGVIQSVNDEEISVDGGPRTSLRSVPLSGLKHRLSRVKKKLKSR